MYNKVIFVGNLTRDIDFKHSQSGSAIANTAIAASRKFTSNGEKKEEVCFVDITFFARSAEIANQYLRKGSKILVEGRLNFDQWVDQNGQKRSKHSIVVETMQMLDSKGDNQNGGGNNAPAHGGQSSYQAPQQQQQSYNAPQQHQQSYQAPQQQQQPAYNNQANVQNSAMPNTDSVPVNGVEEEDEIPF